MPPSESDEEEEEEDEEGEGESAPVRNYGMPPTESDEEGEDEALARGANKISLKSSNSVQGAE
jgi:hypothetical protein